MVFLLETMFFQWFWSGQPLVPMGFSMVFPLETMVFQWFWVWQTIGTNGFSMVFPLETMVFQWFPMVANHWSNDGMVTIHRRGLHLSHQDKQQDIEKLVQPLHFYKKNHDQEKIGKSAKAKRPICQNMIESGKG